MSTRKTMNIPPEQKGERKMKKAMILFILLIGFSVLIANTQSGRDMAKRFEDSLKLTQSSFDGLLNVSIEFSQEEYTVGDIIDVTIHFEVNTEQNTENLNFAVVNYINQTLYSTFSRHLEIVTKEVLEYQQQEYAPSTATCKLIAADSDLILGNENPTGDYHISFKLTKKHPVIHAWGETYPYMLEYLTIYAFTETITYPHITDYRINDGRRFSEVTIPIRLHPAARINKKPSGNPGTAPRKPAKELPTKQTPVKIGRGGRETLQVVHAFVFNV